VKVRGEVPAVKKPRILFQSLLPEDTPVRVPAGRVATQENGHGLSRSSVG